MHIMVSGVSSGCDNMESQNLTWVHYGTIQLCVTILQPKQEKFLRHPQTPLETSLRNLTCTHVCIHITMYIYMYLRAYIHTHLQPEALSSSSKRSRYALPNKIKNDAEEKINLRLVWHIRSTQWMEVIHGVTDRDFSKSPEKQPVTRSRESMVSPTILCFCISSCGLLLFLLQKLMSSPASPHYRWDALTSVFFLDI